MVFSVVFPVHNKCLENPLCIDLEVAVGDGTDHSVLHIYFSPILKCFCSNSFKTTSLVDNNFAYFLFSR